MAQNEKWETGSQMTAKDQVESDWKATHEGVLDQLWKVGRAYDVRRKTAVCRHLRVHRPSELVTVYWMHDGESVEDSSVPKAVAHNEFIAICLLIKRLTDKVRP